MTTVVLFRHGKAAPRGDYANDADRPLTDDGVEKTAACARGLARLVDAAFVLSSPLVRARQTAELVCKAQSGSVPLKQIDELACGVDPQALVRQVDRLGADPVVLVGHEPDMSDLVAWMTCEHADVSVNFGKAAACCIAFDGSIRAGGGTLRWLLQASALRLLAD